MHRLRGQMLLSYIPLILVPVLLVGLVTRSAAERGLTLVLSREAQQQARALSQCMATYYQENRSWKNLFEKPFAMPVFVVGNQQPKVFEIVNNKECYVYPERRPFESLKVSVESAVAHEKSADIPPPDAPGEPITLENPMEPVIINEKVKANAGFGIISSAPAVDMIFTSYWSPDMQLGFGSGGIVITDLDGNVVTANMPEHLNQKLSVETLAQGAPIVVDGQTVGMLVVNPVLSVLAQQQLEPLNAVNQALVLSGLVSVGLAVSLGVWMSWQITNPVRQLMAGVKRLATGEWTTPLEVTTNNEFGELTHAFNSMASDLTRQHQLNRQMVADIAHDLRTPLSIMALEVEAIEAGFQTPAEATTSLRSEITWLQRLVDDLRLLSLMDADQIRLQTECVPLQPFLCSIFDFWQTLAHEENRCLTLDVPQQWPEIMIDQSRMRQVLGNLLDNAVRHTKPGGLITLGVSVHPDCVEFRVSDDGEGIPPEELAHIFDRFYRGDKSRGHNNNGSGLGLSIANRLVEMHGGNITVISQRDEGTTFTIRIPSDPACLENFRV